MKKKILLPLLLIATLGLLVALPQIVIAAEHEQTAHHLSDEGTGDNAQGNEGEGEHNGTEVSFHIHLTGEQQVSPTVNTTAFGFAEVSLSKDNTTLSFELVVCNIANVTASHIHVGAAGTNGPIVLPFFSSPPLFNSTDGCDTLAHGTRTSADLIARPEAGISNWNDFIKALIAGNTYINVHTTAHPLGEIRGQLVSHVEHENDDENEGNDSVDSVATVDSTDSSDD